MKPLYKIWSYICHEKKVTPLLFTLSDEEKKEIYQKIKNAMHNDKKEIYLYRYSQPYQIKRWLEEEHHIKCYVQKIQVINSHISGYQDSHYCYITW